MGGNPNALAILLAVLPGADIAVASIALPFALALEEVVHELALVAVAVGIVPDAGALELALDEVPFVARALRRRPDPLAMEEIVLEGAFVEHAAGQNQIALTGFLAGFHLAFIAAVDLVVGDEVQGAHPPGLAVDARPGPDHDGVDLWLANPDLAFGFAVGQPEPAVRVHLGIALGHRARAHGQGADKHGKHQFAHRSFRH